MKTAENYLDEALTKAATPDENGNCPNLRECFLEAMEAYAGRARSVDSDRSCNTPEFTGWADVFFDANNGNLDRCIVKEVAFDDLRTKTRAPWRMQYFTKAMKAWCSEKGFTYNPGALLNAQGRIIKRVNDLLRTKDGSWMMLDTKSIQEMMYVQTKAELNDLDDLSF